MNSVLSDEELVREIVDSVDDAIINWILKYELHPVELVGIILARLLSIAKETNGEDAFLELIDEVKSSIMMRSKTNTVIH